MSYVRRNIPGTGSLVLASLFPALVIAIEFATGLCAGTFFDPVPTLGHLLLVGMVPAINWLLWRSIRQEEAPPRWWLVTAGGASMAIAASYSLLFLPLLPFATVAIIFFGIGLLPFAPVLSLVYASRWTVERAGWLRRGMLPLTGGVAAGVLLLVLIDLPATATQMALARYQGDAAERRRAVTLMRLAGDRDLLLRLSYGDTARATGVFSFLVSTWSNGPFWSQTPPTADARELYYRATGEAFNAKPQPGHGPAGRMRWSGWDDDQGGDSVGGRVPELTLAGSRIDGSVASRDNLGRIEWTFDLHNAGDVAREGRFTLALPEGAVASRATLWINGEPREASIAGRGAVRAAYASVVRRSRDPLLVTTDGAQRLLVQAFPINPHSTMRLRIGIIAPFTIASDGTRALALPAMVERNLDLGKELRHAVWIEGDAPLAGVARAQLTDAALLSGRARILLPRATVAWRTSGGVPARGEAPALAIQQTIAPAAARPRPLILVVDASVDTQAAAVALAPALDAVAPGVPVGLVVAGDGIATVAPAPWSPSHAKRLRGVLEATDFRGGQDARAGLARALSMMPDEDATLLWVHGVQPVRFTRPEPALDQALERLATLPALVRYQAVPGRASTIEGARWFDTARLPAPSGDARADLRAILSDLAGTRARWAVTRMMQTAPAHGSADIVRLWAAERLASSAGSIGKQREADIALAHRLNVISPVSGAVVLESDRDYTANGLPVPDPDAVPTIPEPETWALMILLALAGLWLLRRRQVAWA